MEPQTLTVRGKPARVYVAGSGPALLLIHGGWGGAQLHWAPVWERLARAHRVIAPDLPGLGALEQAPLASVADYVDWLVELLDGLAVAKAWCVGNSFGGSVAWSLAGRHPERCAGLVLVNGIPMGKTPAPMLWLGRTWPGRALMRAMLRRFSYSTRNLPLGFADLEHVPAALREMLRAKHPVLLDRFTDLVIAGDGPPPPRVAPHLLWGEADHLPGTDVASARKLQATLPGSTLALVARAGHFPQVEAPAAFAAQLEALVRAG